MEKMDRIALRVAKCTLEDVSTVRFSYLVECINDVRKEIDELIEEQHSRVRKTKKTILEKIAHLKECVDILLRGIDELVLEHALTSQNNFHNLWHHTWSLYLRSTRYKFRSMHAAAQTLARKLSRTKRRLPDHEHEYVLSIIDNYCVVRDLADEMGLCPKKVASVVNEFNRYLARGE